MKYTDNRLCITSGELGRICGDRDFSPLSPALSAACARSLGNVRTNVRLTLDLSDGGVDFRISALADAADTESGTFYAFIGGPAGPKPTPGRMHSQEMLIGACIFAAENALSSVTVCAVIAGDAGMQRVEKTYRTEELGLRLAACIDRVHFRASFEKDRAMNVLPSLCTLPFPHGSLREGQRELIETVFTSVRGGDRLFAQAPTGIGKTVSVLYGAVRAMGKDGFRRIFFLTAKASTRREAFSAAGLIHSAGGMIRACVLDAKEQSCPMCQGGDFFCDPQSCPLMKHYASERGNVLREMLASNSGYPSSLIRQYAQKYSVCPYELSLDLSEFCDVIICDYNYVFDPGVYLRRYFEDGVNDPDENVFLIDEAHNLTERARDIYSSSLTPADFSVLDTFAEHFPDVKEAIRVLVRRINLCRRLCSDNLRRDDDGNEYGYYFNIGPLPHFDDSVSALCEAAGKYLVTHKEDRPAASAAASVVRKCRKWLDSAEGFSDRYRTYVSVDRGTVTVQQYCLDPSERLGACLSKGRSAVFFSATLTPSDYFADVLGGGKDCRHLSLPSPFPRENLFIGALTGINTRYGERDKSVKKLVYAIAAAAAAKPGNYIVFFPSYAFLKPVSEAFVRKYPKVPVIIQKSGMNRSEKDEFLSFFKEDTGKLRIGFCVLGGSFSEGIDLPGSRLIGTVIAGVGLPGLSAERNMIAEYYNGSAERGYDYAYTYPGMNAVLQAAGRVIRRDTDRGIVLLCDDRYAAPAYRELMPPHWDGLKIIDDITALPSLLRDFWNS